MAPLIPFMLLAGWLADQIPSREAGSQFMAEVDKLLKRIAALAPKIIKEREREVQRLLDKLRDDPDEGLKYALPMSDVQGRGVANPSNRLPERNVNFRLGGFGGGPADSWAIEAALQAQLIALYRQNAAREVRLGRYRRAAYIHASLLGDHQAAANVLEQGRFFYEAAAVYRDTLKRPVDAARCFERGGLLQDAIDLYADLKQHIKVGELYERLDQPDDARAAFERAVDDRLAAADLLQQRLKDDEAAMTVLEGGWPSCSQATLCLERFFALTHSANDPARAVRKVEELQTKRYPSHRIVDLISTLSRVAVTQTDETVKTRSADATRVLASEVLQRDSSAPARVLRAIADLAPEDMLLGRDTRRVGQSVQKLVAVTTSRREVSTQSKIGQFHRKITLPAEYHWLHGEAVGKHYFLVGHDSDRTVMLLRGCSESWEMSQVSATWNGRGSADGGQPVMLRHQEQVVHIAQAGCQPFSPRLLKASDDFPHSCMAETPGWLPNDAVAMASNMVTTCTCNAMGETILFNRNGLKYSAGHLPGFVYGDHELPTSTIMPVMHARTRDIYIGFGSTLFRITETGPQQSLQFPSPITGISGTRPHTRERLLVTHETGAFVLSPTVNSFGETMIEEQNVFLRGCLLDDHRVVLWRPGFGISGEFLLYAFAQDRVVFQGRTTQSQKSTQDQGQPAGPSVLMLLPTSIHNQVATIPSGVGRSIELWSFPS